MEFKYDEIKKTTRYIKTQDFYKDFVKVFDKKIIETNGIIQEFERIFISTKENVQNVKELDIIPTSIKKDKDTFGSLNIYMLSKENYNNLLTAKKHISDNIFEDYDDIKYNTNDYMMVLFNFCNYDLYDLDFNRLPIAVHVSYEYTNGRMTNSQYDLKSVCELLKDDDKVFCYLNKPYSDKVMNCTLQITPIPYYNADDTDYEQLDFYFVPDSIIYKEAMQIKNSHARVPYMLEKTFGIKQKIKKPS